METGPGAPTPPIAIAGGAAAATARLDARRAEISDDLLTRLQGVCASVTDDPAVTGSASQDWWPLAMTWALEGQLAGRAAVVARPDSPDQVAAVFEHCLTHDGPTAKRLAQDTQRPDLVQRLPS